MFTSSIDFGATASASRATWPGLISDYLVVTHIKVFVLSYIYRHTSFIKCPFTVNNRSMVSHYESAKYKLQPLPRPYWLYAYHHFYM